MAMTPLAVEERPNMPSYNHSYLAYRIARSIDVRDLFNLHIELSIDINGKEFVAGVAVYKRRPINFLRDEIRTTNMPLMVAEILSPTQLISDLIDKAEIYLEAGIQSYWLIVPSTQTITVFHDLENPRTYSHGEIADPNLGINVPLDSIFA